MKPGNPPLQSIRVLDQLRERIRYMHYSLSTEQVYVYWVRFFIRWSTRGGQMRHPRELGAPDEEAFLTMLATQRRVSAFTHNQTSPLPAPSTSPSRALFLCTHHQPRKDSPMFIPFLAAATVAAAFAQLGAMTVNISVLTKALQALSIAFIMVVIAAIALLSQRQQKA